jgi:hypothetical protein
MVRHSVLAAGILCALAFSGLAAGQAYTAPTPSPSPNPTATSAPGKQSTDAAATQGAAKTTPVPTSPVSIVGQPVMKVEPLCNPGGQGEAKIQVKNTGPATSFSPVAGDPTSKSPAKTLANAKIDFRSAPNNLPVNQTIEITAHASQVFDDGDYESQVQNQGAVIGSIRIVRPTVPFSITLDAANPDAPELTFVYGQEGNFRLKNGDPVAYTLAWEYTVDGVTVRSSDPVAITKKKKSWPCRWFCKDESARSQGSNQQDMSIMATGQQNFSFNPPDDWFPGWFTGLFKENVSDGYLTIYRIEAACQEKRAAAKTIKVKTHRMRRAPGLGKEFLGDIVIFMVLAAGGIMSLLLNLALPNQSRRLRVKQQLEALGEKVGNLSWALASRLRVLAGLQYGLIRDQLASLTAIDSDFASDMQKIEGQMAQLSTRLDFLAALGDVRVNFEKARAGNMPPSTTFALEDKFARAVEIGTKASPTDAELQSAQALIKEIQDTLDSGVQVTAASISDVVKRIKAFKDLFDQTNGRLGKTGTFADVKNKLPGPFDDLTATKEDTLTVDTVTAEMFVVLDRMLFKLRMLAEYIRLVEGLPAGNALRDTLLKRQPLLIDLASKNSWSAMYDADRLLREMEAGIFAEDVGTELRAKNVWIDFDPQIIRPHRPVQFSLKFLKGAFNGTPATEEWTCRWTFSRPEEQTLTEEGWTVTHYFQRGGDYSVKVELTHSLSGAVVVVENVEKLPEGKIRVSPDPRRSWRRAVWLLMTGRVSEAKKEWRKRPDGAGRVLDYLRLMLALVIALLGLLAGAQEQLLKLDVLPALVAIFLLGFGADQVKNLFTQKPAGGDASAQH